MASRSNLARMSAVILGASTALMLAAALPASADVSPANTPANTPAATPNALTGATGTITGKNDDQGWVKMLVSGKSKNEPTALMELAVKGQSTPDLMYCVELTVEEGGRNSTMVGQTWDSFPPDPNSNFGPNTAAQINWVLHNSFPTISDLPTLAADAGIKTTGQGKKKASSLTATEAVEATQAAIWSYSENNVKIDAKNNDANVLALYKYLTGGPAKGLAQPSAKQGAVSITKPSDTKGTAGSLIGPYTVNSNLTDPLTLTTSQTPGVKMTDANGKAIDPNNIVDGTKIYFDVAAGTDPSSAWFKVDGQFQVGELFVGQDVAEAATKPGGVKVNCKNVTMQSLIVAKSSDVSDEADATWSVVVPSSSTSPTTTTVVAPTTTTQVVVPPVTTTTAPPQVKTTSQSLPFTGVSLVLPVGLAVVLIGAGAAFLIMQRRRKRA